MLNTSHKLSVNEADHMKDALLSSLALVISPVDVARELIKAFALIDEATAGAASSRVPAEER